MEAPQATFFNSVSIIEPPSPVLIVIFGTSPPCALNVIQQVSNKRQSNSPDLVGKTQELGAVVDRNFPNDIDYASIFSKVIGQKLSHSSRDDIYTHCRVNFAADRI